jgi:hypothetical protein
MRIVPDPLTQAESAYVSPGTTGIAQVPASCLTTVRRAPLV